MGLGGRGPERRAARAIAQLLAARFGIDVPAVAHAAAHRRGRRCGRRASRRRRRSRRSARRRRSTAPATPTASRFATSCAAARATSRTRPTSSRSRRDEADVAALLDWCAGARAVAIPYGGGSSVVGGVEAPRGDAYRGVVSHRPRPARPGARDRPHLARGAHPGRRARPRARGPAPPARPHAAALPAVVRVLDARRLDRDALRRPLRDALHAHRRLRRVAARGHTDAASSRPAGCPARAPGPSPTASSSAPKASSASSPKRGCGCRTGRRSAPRRRSRFPTSSAGAAAARALGQTGLYPSNCRLLDAGEAMTSARVEAPSR